MRLWNTGDAQTEMNLFQRFEVGKNSITHLRDRFTGATRMRIVISLLHRAKPSCHLVDHCGVLKIAGDRDDHPARLITGLEKFNDVLAPELVDGFLPAANRPADRMVLEEIEIEKIMHVIVGGVFRLGNLL